MLLLEQFIILRSSEWSHMPLLATIALPVPWKSPGRLPLLKLTYQLGSSPALERMRAHDRATGLNKIDTGMHAGGTGASWGCCMHVRGQLSTRGGALSLEARTIIAGHNSHNSTIPQPHTIAVAVRDRLSRSAAQVPCTALRTQPSGRKVELAEAQSSPRDVPHDIALYNKDRD